MKNLECIYKSNMNVPELIWHRISDAVCETRTNGRYYIIVETNNLANLTIKSAESNFIMSSFDVKDVDYAKSLAEHIEGFYCQMNNIDMEVEF